MLIMCFHPTHVQIDINLPHIMQKVTQTRQYTKRTKQIKTSIKLNFHFQLILYTSELSLHSLHFSEFI